MFMNYGGSNLAQKKIKKRKLITVELEKSSLK